MENVKKTSLACIVFKIYLKCSAVYTLKAVERHEKHLVTWFDKARFAS